MITRPALAAVTEALAGVADPGEAVEILVARDLWPMERAPYVIVYDEEPGAKWVARLASVASLGLAQIAALDGIAREYLESTRSWRGTEESEDGVAWDTAPGATYGSLRNDREQVDARRMGADLSLFAIDTAAVIVPPLPDLRDLQPSPMQLWRT